MSPKPRPLAKTALTLIAGAALFAGPAPQTRAGVPRPRKVERAEVPAVWRNLSGRERLRIRRVAELDAYRALAERIYGLELESGTVVQDFVMESDRIRSRVKAVLKGARETEPAVYTEDGTVQVVMGVTMRKLIEALELSRTEDAATVTYEKTREDRVIEALGQGAIPDTDAHRMLLAKRAAEVDAARKMAERVKGVTIEGRTSVQDFCTVSDRVRASVAAFLKGLKPVDIVYTDDGVCEVTMQLRIRRIVEVVEVTAKRTGNWPLRKTTEEVSVTRESEDKVFEVTGRGTWEAPAAVPGGVNAAIDSETSSTLTIRRVLGEKVVVE